MNEKKVISSVASSNVFPITYYTDETKYYTDMLREKGKEAVEIDILKNYENGNFQGGSNKYTKALKIMQNLDEYSKYDWRIKHNFQYGSKEYNEFEQKRRSPEFDEFLGRVLKMKPKEKYVGYIDSFYGKFYVKKTRNYIKYISNKSKATKFFFEKEIDSIMKEYNITNGKIKVEEIGC